MIYTVTFNPAVDYVMHMTGFSEGALNRSEREELYIGGKGINVSAVLSRLGIASTALGFIAGATGDMIENGVRDMGVCPELIRLKEGNSRINVKVKSGLETEFNGCGPRITSEALDMLFGRLDRLTAGDTLVLAGSVPSSLPSDIYETILKRLSGRGIRFAVDAAGELLLKTLCYEPFVVKPNDIELGELFGVTLTGRDMTAEYAHRLKAKGARNVLVSMAEKGALLISEDDKEYFCPACKGEVINSVGAGDSMLAGFLAGMAEKNDPLYALKLGTAAGGATAFSGGLGEKELIYRLLTGIE